jgi:hypothetical protein
MNKFIFVSGGVCSSLGKGVAASSLGALLEGRGLNAGKFLRGCTIGGSSRRAQLRK